MSLFYLAILKKIEKNLKKNLKKIWKKFEKKFEKNLKIKFEKNWGKSKFFLKINWKKIEKIKFKNI